MSGRKPKILVVDDQRGIRLTLSAIMAHQGYSVTEAEDGYQAIDAVSKSDFDLIFLDIKMPGINGVQAFREMKKVNGGCVVVMMTGFALEDLVREALDEGASAVIYKPFQIDKVIGLVESYANPGDGRQVKDETQAGVS